MNEIQMKTDIPKLKLTRGQRGGYGWDISVPHLDLEVAAVLRENESGYTVEEGALHSTGIIDGLVLTIGDSINTGVTQLLRFRLRVTVPYHPSNIL